MNCEQVRLQLAEYWAERLKPAERDALEAHLASCAACRLEVAELGEVWNGMEELAEVAPDAGARERFREVLRAYQAGQAAGRADSRPARASGWTLRPAWQAALAASLLIAGALCGRYLTPARRTGGEAADMAQLQAQVGDLRRLVTLALLREQSPSSRLRGVTYTYQIQQPDREVRQALLYAVNRDSNVNVRLSAVDALEKLAGDPAVRQALADAIPVQDSPLVQVALIDLLVDLRDANAVPALRALVHNAQANEAARQRAAWGLERLEGSH
jgi:hypothetical protein